MAGSSSIRSGTLTALALLVLSSYYSSAFVGPQSSFTLVPHRQQANQFLPQELTGGITSLNAKNSNNKNNKNSNDNLESKITYTKIDDGSPLGVAIVGIGGLLYSKGGDTFSFLQQQDSSDVVWIILATASTAAGLSRLVRYISDKQNKSSQ
mmetsp:Transcript_19420/g.33108  ORF Transcript_19420/g.33108 Transcript_19420/m.33108 type:complete len:152 (-) Transcript_19420:660-1115(-)